MISILALFKELGQEQYLCSTLVPVQAVRWSRFERDLVSGRKLALENPWCGSNVSFLLLRKQLYTKTMAIDKGVYRREERARAAFIKP